MTSTRHGSAVIEFPSDLEILITREFHAPIQLVFDVLTKAEHARNTIAPSSCRVSNTSPTRWTSASRRPSATGMRSSRIGRSRRAQRRYRRSTS